VKRVRFLVEPDPGLSADLRMAYLVVILCKIRRKNFEGMRLLSHVPKGEGRGAPFVVGAEERKSKSRSFPPSLTPSTKNRSLGTPVKNGYGQDDTTWEERWERVILCLQNRETWGARWKIGALVIPPLRQKTSQGWGTLCIAGAGEGQPWGCGFLLYCSGWKCSSSPSAVVLASTPVRSRTR
jgi:hypothetical protein